MTKWIVLPVAVLLVTGCSGSSPLPSTGDAAFDACLQALTTGDAGEQPDPSVQVTGVWECIQMGSGSSARVDFLRASGDTSPLVSKLLSPASPASTLSPTACPPIGLLPQQFVIQASGGQLYSVKSPAGDECGEWRPSSSAMETANFELVQKFTPTPSAS